MVANNKAIDLVSQRIAAIYGKAVFDAAVAEGNRDEVIEQLDSLVTDVLDASPQLDALFGNPMISAEQKLAIIQAIFSGRALPIVLSFLQAVAKNQRLVYLRSCYNGTPHESGVDSATQRVDRDASRVPSPT